MIRSLHSQPDKQFPVWHLGETRVLCKQVIQETPDVKTFLFQTDSPQYFDFKPGQFLTLKLIINGETVYRSYTISSSPSRPYHLAITVKKIPGGLVSNWFFDHLSVGDEVLATGCSGEFNLVDIPARKYLFLSAGSGITPMMSMSRWLLDTENDGDIQFIHSARSESDIIFRRELEQLNEHYSNFSTDFILETESVYSKHHGRLSLSMLEQLVPDLDERTVYVCGPAPYMDSVKNMMEEIGFDMSRFHQESFGAPAPVIELELADKKSTAFRVRVASSDKVMEIDPSETILDSLEKHGLPAVSACRAGVCGACKVLALDGTVVSTSQMTLTPDEIEKGYFLSCCSKADSDVTLEL